MRYNQFGNTGITTSRLGMGCMRLPTLKDGENTVIDRERAIAIIRHGIDNGISYVDTAYGYHNRESEIVVGLALKDGYRERTTLTTKLPTWNVNEPADLDHILDEQLSKLDVPYLDFYIIHALNKGSFEKMKSLGYKSFLKRAKADGRIRHTGFSFHDDNKTFHEIIDDFDEWELAQIQFNYLDNDKQAGEEGLHYAGKRGIPIVIMEPLRGGLLASPPAEIAQKIADHPSGLSPVAWAFRYVANFPEVKTILSGMSTMEQMVDNLKLFDGFEANSMTDADKAFVGELKKAYLARMPIGCTGCHYCVPCPQNVQIPDIFHMYNESRMFDRPEGFVHGYSRMIEKNQDASQCVECRRCEGLCPQQLPITDWLKKVDAEGRQ